ncbi:MAG: Gfo/Idh/MocA family oxidoreductase [bacterium]|nr:Gfo/Idh/MocA family oxidoreductase [bacterium]
MSVSLPRRNLLAAASVLPFQSVSSSAANSAVKVGLIGAGGRGTLDATLLTEHTSARVTAICDIVPERMERAMQRIPVSSPKLYEDYRELLASDVDAVIIATPVFLHPEHFEAAVKAGKHIYIEKPAAADVAGCKRLMKAADSASRDLNISFGFQQRYGPGYHSAKQLIDSGELGKIRMAISYWIKGAITGDEPPVPRPRTDQEKVRDWKRWRETFGDIIVETYVHGIDVLNWFLGGHPAKAMGSGGRTLVKRGDMMDHVNVTFTYSDEVQAVLTGTQIAPRFYRDVREQFICASSVVETARHYWKHYRGKNDAVTENMKRDITADALDEFIRRIQEGKPENTGVRSAESTLTALMGRMAIDEKREVTWEEVLNS